MDKALLNILERITAEEQKILNGNKEVEKSNYTDRNEFIVERNRMLAAGELIAVRTHTRFIDFPLHGHDYIEMIYVCKGSITHCINGCQVVMDAGDILLLNQNAQHAIKAAGANDIGINLLILPEFFDAALQMLEKGNFLADFLVDLLRHEGGSSQYLHFKLSDNLQTSNLMENLVYSLVHKQPGQNRINQYLIGLLLMYLLQNAKALNQEAPNNYEDVVLRALLHYIENNYKTATLTEFAQNMNQTLTGMSLLIKSKTGGTFKELLQRKRFQKALALICDTNLSIRDIIAAIGYENSSYFHRKFREKYGMSPNEYRQKAEKSTAIRI